jgi:hypothetical protein
VRLRPLGTATSTGLLYQPQMIDNGDCGETGGMNIGRGNRSTRRKPTPVPLCPLRIMFCLNFHITTFLHLLPKVNDSNLQSLTCITALLIKHWENYGERTHVPIGEEAGYDPEKI